MQGVLLLPIDTSLEGRDAVYLEIEGEPKGKGRPRFMRVGKAVRTYTPAATRDHEKRIAKIAKDAMGERKPMTGPVIMTVVAHVGVAASWSKNARELALNGYIAPTKTPDCDNVLKLVSDALNGIVYEDDKQIISVNIRKLYSATPGIGVIVEQIDLTPQTRGTH